MSAEKTGITKIENIFEKQSYIQPEQKEAMRLLKILITHPVSDARPDGIFN